MENNKSHEQLMYMLGQIDSKLDGVNKRLDTVNGRLGKHDEHIATLNTFKDTLTGKLVMLSALFSLLSATIIKFLVLK